jgi:hypothetical protein
MIKIDITATIKRDACDGRRKMCGAQTMESLFLTLRSVPSPGEIASTLRDTHSCIIATKSHRKHAVIHGNMEKNHTNVILLRFHVFSSFFLRRLV